MSYLHISQHWGALLIRNGYQYKPPEKLERLDQVEILRQEPFNVNFRIDDNNFKSWGESLYQINEDKSLTYLGGNYDTSD